MHVVNYKEKQRSDYHKKQGSGYHSREGGGRWILETSKVLKMVGFITWEWVVDTGLFGVCVCMLSKTVFMHSLMCIVYIFCGTGA
jgi:hypothetical protein